MNYSNSWMQVMIDYWSLKVGASFPHVQANVEAIYLQVSAFSLYTELGYFAFLGDERWLNPASSFSSIPCFCISSATSVGS